MRTVFIRTLCDIAEKDDRIWLLCGDLGYSVLECFASRFPNRFVNVGVAEQNMAGMAAGLSMCGKIVFIYSIANFPTLRCLEQIRNDICFHKANVKIVAVGGGLAYGPHGMTHQGLEDLAIMRALPSMSVVAPGDPVETMLATQAVVSQEGPCYLRLGRGGEPVAHQTEPDFKIGKMISVKNGSDILAISTGNMLRSTLEAAQKAGSKDCSVAVWSCPWLKPIDTEAVVKAAATYRVILTVEEAQINGGLGGAIAEILASLPSHRASLKRLGVPDIFLREAYTQNVARAKIGLDASALCQAMLSS